MKKLLSLVIILSLCITMVTGCGKSAVNNNENKQNTETTAASDTSSDSNTASNTEETSKTPETVDTKTADTSTTDKKDIKVAALKGPTAMGMVKIMDDAQQGKAANNYEFTIAGAADEITAGIISGDYDMAAIPCNLASVLYNKSRGGLKVAGINTLGVLYVVETGNEINNVADLKGKTIYSTGKGTTPEYTLNYLLSSSGIDPAKDVNIEYKSEATEVAAILSQADNAIAVLPQPYVTTVMMNNKKVRIALDITKEWNKVSSNKSTIVTGVIVVNSKFLETNKEAVDTFLSEYDSSVQFVNNNTEEAAALIEKFDILKAAAAQKALPYCNITSIQGEEMKEKISAYLQTLFDQNPDTVGGAMPDDGFYYINQ
jgi:NitT/TauT family transport system substrate-binding protein